MHFHSCFSQINNVQILSHSHKLNRLAYHRRMYRANHCEARSGGSRLCSLKVLFCLLTFFKSSVVAFEIRVVFVCKKQDLTFICMIYFKQQCTNHVYTSWVTVSLINTELEWTLEYLSNVCIMYSSYVEKNKIFRCK